MRKYLTTLVAALFATAAAFAHCDSVDGPVVQAARRALASGDVNVVLPWVQPRDEAAIREAFTRAVKIRGLNRDAAALADTWFFETVVRIHRAGEGEPFDGLKPAGAVIAPGLQAADHAIETGTAEALQKTLAGALHSGLRQRFERVLEAREYKSSDLDAGRKYVAAYVDFIHFAERLHEALRDSAAAEHHH